MAVQRFPTWYDQPGSSMTVFKITGTDVSSVTAGSAGLDGRGKNFCTAIKSGNRVTLSLLRSWAGEPYVFFQPAPGQNDTIVQIVTNTASQIVFDTVKANDNSAVNNADLYVFVVGFNTTNYVS